MEADQDQVNLPQRSQRRLPADSSPGPQLLSCGWPGLSQSPPLEPPAGLACCQGMWDNQLQGEVEVTLMKEMQKALIGSIERKAKQITSVS